MKGLKLLQNSVSASNPPKSRRMSKLVVPANLTWPLDPVEMFFLTSSIGRSEQAALIPELSATGTVDMVLERLHLDRSAPMQ
jgi:hypothetical protein